MRSGLAITVKTPRSLPGDCRVIAPEEGLPGLGFVEIELHRAPGQMTEAFETFCEGLETAVTEDIAAHHERADM